MFTKSRRRSLVRRDGANPPPKHLLVGSIDALELVNLTNHWDIVLVSGRAGIASDMTVSFDPCGSPPCSLTDISTFSTNVQQRVFTGGNVQLAIGLGGSKLATLEDVNKVVASIGTLIEEYHFSGVDIDLYASGCEDSADFTQPPDATAALLITMIQNLRKDQGSNFLLSTSVTITVNDAGALLYTDSCPSVIYGLRDVLNFTVATMYHASTGDPQTDYIAPTGEKFMWATTAHWVAAADTLLGAGTSRSTSSIDFGVGFAGLRPEQLYIFCDNPTPTSARVVVAALNCITLGQQCDGYTPRMQAPSFAGFHVDDIWKDETQLGNDFHEQMRQALQLLDITLLNSPTSTSASSSSESPSSSTTSGLPTQTAQPTGTGSHVPKGVIAAVTVIGVLVLSLISGFLWYRFCRSRRNQRDTPHVQVFPVPAPRMEPAAQPTVEERKREMLLSSKDQAAPQARSQLGNRESQAQNSEGIGELHNALNGAGFSMGALVASLRRVENEAEGGAPPVYS